MSLWFVSSLGPLITSFSQPPLSTDVGGGAVPNETRNSLARIPLRWMIRQCFLLKTGILFQREMLRYVGMDPDTLYPHVIPRPPLQPTPPEVPRREPSASTSASSSAIQQNPRLSFWTDDFESEEQEDLRDALTPINDMLSSKWGWWLLEIIPQRFKYQKDDDYSWVQRIV